MVSKPSAADGETSDAPSNSVVNLYPEEEESLLNRAAEFLQIKKKFRWANPNFFHEQAIYSWIYPYSYQLPGCYSAIELQLEVGNEETDTAENSPLLEEVDEDPDEKKEKSREGEEEEMIGRRRPRNENGAKMIKYLDVFRRKFRGSAEDRFIGPIDGRLIRLVVQSTKESYDSKNKTTWRRTYINNVSPYIVRLANWPQSVKYGRIESWKRKDWIYAGLRWLVSSIALLIVVSSTNTYNAQVDFDFTR